jgi:hypothetical protein
MDRERFRHGIELFNRGEFFEAHEVLEDVWRAAPQAEKKFLQGLIQVAVALHHHSTGNLVGARSLLERGARNLKGYPANFAGLESTALLRTLAHWGSSLHEGVDPPPLPRLELWRE